MRENYILSIDQGTSGTKVVIFDTEGRVVVKGTEPLASYYPQPGFVEQDPQELYQNVLLAVKTCLSRFREEVSEDLSQITTCGISNQRETFCLWDTFGQPMTPAIVWQCKRSVDICSRLHDSSLEQEIVKRTGLIVDPYFSASKLIWLCENNNKINLAIGRGDAYFGTVDTWLLYKLTGGRCYYTDYTNASRTLFFNIDQLSWDRYLLQQFGLSSLRLPRVRPSSFDFGSSDFEGLLPAPISISAMIGDSHAAAFGEGCFSPGTAKATMGTGCSILLNTGSKRVLSANGMVTTICWSAGDRVDYALEGIIVSCGATINWLKDNLGMLKESSESEAMAQSVSNSNGVSFIPAFNGLGAPYWNMDVKALITGLTLGCNENHIVRAALESIPYQIKDVIEEMEFSCDIALEQLRVDGGISQNKFIMQLLADILQKQVTNIGMQDVSAFGAACLAGLQEGIFQNLDQLPQNVLNEIKYDAFGRDKGEEIQRNYDRWKKAVRMLNASGNVPNSDIDNSKKDAAVSN